MKQIIRTITFMLVFVLIYGINIYAGSNSGAQFPYPGNYDTNDTPGYDLEDNKVWRYQNNKLRPEDDPGEGPQGFWAYIDDTTGDVCIDTRDRVHTSSILYRTGGFSMSRCKFNPALMELADGKNTEDVVYQAQSAALPSQHAYSTEGGIKYEYSSFRYPFETLVNAIAGDTSSKVNHLSWIDEINMVKEGKSDIYFRFDGFLYISHDEGKNFYTEPYKNVPEDGPYGYNEREKNLNANEIIQAESWKNSATVCESLRQHYNVYLHFGPDNTPELPPVEYTNFDHHITNPGVTSIPGTPTKSEEYPKYAGDGTGAPTWAGGNQNNQGYDAALGVPTTKTLHGYAETIPWYGNIDVWARMVSRTYEPVYTYKWTVDVPNVSGSSLPDAMSYWNSYGHPELIDEKGRDAVSATISGKEDKDGVTGAVKGYTNVKVTFKVVRSFKDIVEGSVAGGGTTGSFSNVKIYAAFQYIDPINTNFYDFEKLKMKNPVYSHNLEFTQRVATEVYIARRKNLKDNTEFKNNSSDLLPRTNNYIKWAPASGVKKELGELNKKYDEAFKDVQHYLSSNTQTCNDTVMVKWKDSELGYEDNGPNYYNNSEGYYLGKKGSDGIVHGCNFRYCKYTSEYGKQLGEIETNKGDEMGEHMSDYWYLCTESAGGNGDGCNNAKNIAHPYMDNGGGTSDQNNYKSKFRGANCTWEILTPQRTTIAANKSNGKYESKIDDIYYYHIGAVVEDFFKSPKRTFGEYKLVKDHLYCNDFSDAGGSGRLISEQSSETLSYHNGAKNSDNPQNKLLPVPSVAQGHYICDPVNVHTPVISPTIITDGGGNHLEHSENIGKTQLVKENNNYDSRVPDDAKDSAELRLDEYYVVHWQDLEEYSEYLNNSDHEHRDIDTPPAEHLLDNGTIGGGYRDQTSSNDQYVKDKFMKFPFEVYYDKKFYAANTWIKVNNPNDEDDIPFDANGVGWGYEPGEGWDRARNESYSSRVKVLDNAKITSKNHWIDTPVYIPTWAKEGLYNKIEGRSLAHTGSKTTLSDFEQKTCMQFMVRAINTSGEQYKKLQDMANTTYNLALINDGAQYVACWSMPVELSGWLYDFTITGTSDADQFAPIDDTLPDKHQINMDQNYSFTKHKQDKKTGVLNRIGEKIIRFAKDGTFENPWNPQNTVTLTGSYDNSSGHTKGKSNVYEDMGNLPKGTSFTYLVRTISNLWDFKGDTAGATIHITPTFSWSKYSEAAGWQNRSHDELQVYYSDDKGNFIPYGTNEDRTNIKKVALGHKQFDDSYYRNDDVNIASHSGSYEYKRYGEWIDYTTFQYNYRNSLFMQSFDNFKTADKNTTLAPAVISTLQWKKAKNNEYSMCDIVLPQKMRLLSGEADQLKSNIYKAGADVTDPSSKYTTYWQMADEGHTFDKIYKGKFDGSGGYSTVAQTCEQYFQSEYGEYKKPMDYAFRDSMQAWYGGYYIPSALYVVDLKNFSWRDLDGHVWNRDEVKNDPKKFIEKYAYFDRAKSDGLQGDEDIFLNTGFLKINFDIYAYKDADKDGTAEPYLKYNGNNGGMWRTQGYDETDSPDAPVPKPDLPKAPPTDPGDVVSIDLSKKWGDRYKAGIFNIN